MNHKRGRPKNRRAGCLLCKPWKKNGVPTEREGGEAHSDHARRALADTEIDQFLAQEDADDEYAREDQWVEQRWDGDTGYDR